MEKPICINGVSPNLCSSIRTNMKLKECECKLYQEHIVSLRTITCHASCKGLWEDGQVLTEGIDYEVKEDYACSRHTYLHPDEKCDGSTVALPIVNREPITEDELWASAIELYLKAKSLYPFSPEKWVSTIQQKYSLTKKQHYP